MRYHGGFLLCLELGTYLFDRPKRRNKLYSLKGSPPPWLYGSITSDLRSNAISDYATDNQNDQNPTQNHVHGTTMPADPF